MGAVRRQAIELATQPFSEREFQGLVLEIARLNNWMVYHTHDSRRSHKGYPDLTLVRAPRLIFAELKSETGRIRPEQDRWLKTLALVPGVETHLWRPSDLDRITKTLSSRHKQAPPTRDNDTPPTPRHDPQ